MSRWLDIARKHQGNSNSLPDTPTKGDKSPASNPATPFCRVLSGCRVEKAKLPDALGDDGSGARKRPDPDAFKERAEIIEHDDGKPRKQAEGLAAQAQGFANVIDFKAAMHRVKKQRHRSKRDEGSSFNPRV